MRVLLVYPARSTFVAQDAHLIAGRHQVIELTFSGLGDLGRLWWAVLGCDVVFCWFGKLHAFFAVLFSKLLRKKAVVGAAGDDVAYQPDIGYGMFSYWWKKWCPLFVFRYADLILCVSRSTLRETTDNANADPARVKLLYHGFDVDKWRRMAGDPKQNLVLTVAHVTNETLRKKGLDLFVQSARHLPDVPFVLVGPWQDGAVDRLKAIAPPNVAFTGGLYGEDLLNIYSRAKVYVQVSVHESFGCSLAEAMLCECVPVVSRRAALPEVVGDCGFYVDELTPGAVATEIESGLVAALGPRARERIAVQFPLDKRREKLLEAITELHR